jgi:putative membrane protein
MQQTTRTHHLLAGLAAACLALFLVPSFAPAASVATTSTGATTTKVTTAFGDREILGVLQTVNLGEIKGGESAKAKAATADVKAYAQEMVRDHRKGEDQVQAAVKAVGATRTSSLSKQLATDNREAMTRLEREKKAGFDRAYLAEQVKMHQMVLDTIDKELLPAASSAKVKDVLTATRATVAEHLQKAKALESKLGG